MRVLLICLCATLLTACGGGGDHAVVAACKQAVADKLAGKPYKLDREALAASLTTDAEGVSSVRGPVVIDPGLSSEQRQTVECSARFEKGQPKPVVISLNFIW